VSAAARTNAEGVKSLASFRQRVIIYQGTRWGDAYRCMPNRHFRHAVQCLLQAGASVAAKSSCVPSYLFLFSPHMPSSPSSIVDPPNTVSQQRQDRSRNRRGPGSQWHCTTSAAARSDAPPFVCLRARFAVHVDS
jgi:hypothetical protein